MVKGGGSAEIYGVTDISRVYRVIHYLNPSFEGSYLKEAQIRFANVVEVHRRVLPSVVFGLANISIGYNFLANCCSIGIDALKRKGKSLVMIGGGLPWKKIVPSATTELSVCLFTFLASVPTI